MHTNIYIFIYVCCIYIYICSWMAWELVMTELLYYDAQLDATSSISPNNWAFVYFQSHRSCTLNVNLQQSLGHSRCQLRKLADSTFVSHPWNYTPHPGVCTLLLSCIHHINLPEPSFDTLNSQQLLPNSSWGKKSQPWPSPSSCSLKTVPHAGLCS